MSCKNSNPSMIVIIFALLGPVWLEILFTNKLELYSLI